MIRDKRDQAGMADGNKDTAARMSVFRQDICFNFGWLATEGDSEPHWHA
jgi:hypothetical protein